MEAEFPMSKVMWDHVRLQSLDQCAIILSTLC